MNRLDLRLSRLEEVISPRGGVICITTEAHVPFDESIRKCGYDPANSRAIYIPVSEIDACL